ncbi:StAR-related lipid transfer protein 13 [Harpegnathos saltator]|uniref:StAR-related lipid transfer protein 13 n=1 Tax=Harpegnathos saltator TaxID=610380 RepID=E2BUV1_HARSA|nr:StAR-related lipid transfer protein 13 [Harpegnathos saltator]
MSRRNAAGQETLHNGRCSDPHAKSGKRNDTERAGATRRANRRNRKVAFTPPSGLQREQLTCSCYHDVRHRMAPGYYQFPIDVSGVAKDHPFLEADSLQSLFRRLHALNRCANMKLDTHHAHHHSTSHSKSVSTQDRISPIVAGGTKRARVDGCVPPPSHPAPASHSPPSPRERVLELISLEAGILTAAEYQEYRIEH